MKNYVQTSEVIEIAAPSGGCVSGELVIVGALAGIANTAADAGEPVALHTVGVYTLPKASATVFAAGARVSWDATGKLAVVPATGSYPIGLATAAAANGATSVRVRLDGVSTSAAA